MSTNKAAILLAHGSRDPNWLAPFQQLANTLSQQLPHARLVLAFMELAQPSLEQQVIKLAQEGFQIIEIIPLFFAEGRHLRQDVPKQLQQLSEQLEQQGCLITLTLHTPVGLEAEVIQGIEQVVNKKLNHTPS